jgi:hypothetical protein
MVTIAPAIPTPAYPLGRRRKIGNSEITWNPKDVRKVILAKDLPYAGEDVAVHVRFLKEIYTRCAS